MLKEKIDYQTLESALGKVEVTIGEVILVEPIKKSSNLKLTVSFKKDGSDNRTVVTNINNEELLGKKFPFITNLFPVIIKKIESQAMILVALNDNSEVEVENYSIGSKLI